MIATTPSRHVINIFKLLNEGKNVIISGPPATGKSYLLSELKYWFCQAPTPTFHPDGTSPFPEDDHGRELRDILPSPDKHEREAFTITFHQGTKYRDFIAGFSPSPLNTTSNFKVVYGSMIHAAEHARGNDCTSCILIDEINRGPAVAIFGDLITSIERDKRLDINNEITPLSTPLNIIDQNGDFIEFFVPYHLYIVAAMNNADTSVEPLDVAFLRRFEIYRLYPDESKLRGFLEIPSSDRVLPQDPANTEDYLECLIRAWLVINNKIRILRGMDMTLGEGIFMNCAPDVLRANIEKTKTYCLEKWNKIYSHISELFYGDPRGLSAVLDADNPRNLIQMRDINISELSVSTIEGTEQINNNNVYSLLKTLSEHQF